MKTVIKVQKRARELNLFWPLDESMMDVELQRLMFMGIISRIFKNFFRHWMMVLQFLYFQKKHYNLHRK